MSIRINKKGWFWSSEFSVENLNDFVITVENSAEGNMADDWDKVEPPHDHRGVSPFKGHKTQKTKKYLNIQVKTNDASVLIVITEIDQGNPPYRIDNQCTCASLRFVQKGIGAGEQETLSPMTSAYYAWSEPTLEKKLLVQAVPIYGPNSNRSARTLTNMSKSLFREGVGVAKAAKKAAVSALAGTWTT